MTALISLVVLEKELVIGCVASFQLHHVSAKRMLAGWDHQGLKVFDMSYLTL